MHRDYLAFNHTPVSSQTPLVLFYISTSLVSGIRNQVFQERSLLAIEAIGIPTYSPFFPHQG